MLNYNAAAGELLIYDEIGPSYWGLIGAADVMAALEDIGDKHVTVRLNTPGGSVDEGIAIYNALKRHSAGVTTIVDSLAASMGSYLLQAGTTRIVASNAMVMIHDPWTIAFGNSAELRKTADVLEKYGSRMIPDYAARSGKSESDVAAIMAAETWYSGQEIIDAGWADTMGEESDAEPITKGLSRFCQNAPASLFAKREKVAAAKSYPRRAAAMAVAKRI